MKTSEEQVEEMAKAIYATGVALDGTDYAFGVYDNDDHFHRMASALIGANIGDVTEWKERAEKHRVQVLPDGTIKQLYSDEEVEDIARQRDEYKHRAEVAERALSWLCDETMRDISIIMYPSIGKQVRDKQELYDYCIEQAEKELAEEEKKNEII